MGRLAKINVGLAGMIAAVLLLATSPILDPKRVSVASQVERLRSGKVAGTAFDYDYLRFDLGRYGISALNELKAGADKDIARNAATALAKINRWGRGPGVPPEQLASRIRLHPDKAVLDPAFVEYLKKTLQENRWQHPACLSEATRKPCDMARRGRRRGALLPAEDPVDSPGSA
jgi:hypothetical protein